MKNFKIGLQLYSIRNELADDFEGTLRKVKEMGYDYVQFANYYGKTGEEIRSILDKIGLTAFSVHERYENLLRNPQGTIETLQALGAKYYVIPWMGIEHLTNEELRKKTLEDIKKAGTLLKEAGIQLLYHNHDFEITNIIEGKYALDYLYDSVSPELLATEIDTCWIKYAGEDPTEYLKKYAGRADVIHLKDFTCEKFGGGPVYALIDENGNADSSTGSREENGFQFRPLGAGLQDIPGIINTCEEIGAEYLIVEQDEPADNSPMESAKISREYLKSLGL